MAKRLFITGATGYIGGSVLDKIIATYPGLEISALLRSPSAAFVSKYGGVKVIRGTFDDFDTIETAAQDADIVVHAGDHDHLVCAKAILSGLAKRTDRSLLLHLTGTACISDQAEQTWDGKASSHVWDDIANIEDIYNLPESAMHRTVDKWVQDASNDLVKTVCICPPDIYGQSSSIGSHSTFLVPKYIETIIKAGEAFYLGQGENLRAVTHIDDVAGLFSLILGKYLNGESLSYGKEGFYLAVVDEIAWKDAAEAINRIGQEQGWLPKGTRTASWDKDRLGALDLGHQLLTAPIILYIWGSNTRANSSRAKGLGWVPQGPKFWDALPEDCRVASEAILKAKSAKNSTK